MVPASLKLCNEPLLLAFIFCTIISVFKTYPTIFDFALSLSLLFLLDQLLPYMRLLFAALVSIALFMVMSPITWHYWINCGSGNANFYFAATLLYNGAQILLATNAISVYLSIDVLRLNSTVDSSQLYQK